MQQKNETPDDFLRRTDTLAAKNHCNVDDLPSILGISRASLYAYRSGKRPIKSKSWRLLEQAEQAAGMEKEKGFGVTRVTPKKGSDAENSANPKDTEKGSSELLPVLLRIAAALEALVEQGQAKAPPTSSEARGKDVA